MKRITFFLSIFMITVMSAQAQKYMTRTGHVNFFSSAPLENIEANNHQVSSILNAQTGEMVFQVLIKSFEFEKALMQEHFNEKYMESGKYPKATYEGTIQNIDAVDFNKNGTYKVKTKGKMTIHGVTREVEANGTIEVKDGKLLVNSKFPVALKDYNIEIPTVVKEKIAETVTVTVDMQYDKLEK